jgi:hypothetical protein
MWARVSLFRSLRRGDYPRPMTGSTSGTAEGALSRADVRRLRERRFEERARWLAERDAFLESSLEPDEQVVARRRNHPCVTDRRILDAKQLSLPPRRGEWVLDAVPFDEVTGWSLGKRHDARPILEVEHRARATIERVPARRFLWFTWGDAERPVTKTRGTFGFGRRTDPVLRAMRTELEDRKIPQGPSFVIRPAGTRAQRMKGSSVIYKAGGKTRIRFGLLRVTHSLYRGELAWPVRVVSWMVLAVPAWFVSPWLVVPAVIVAELCWIALGQWRWHRNRARRTDWIP